ncbi:hypothetical protein [Rhizobium nepotum]|uniref:hypothetical protein n=1 Tax=Rhizobium nepotum TaxID=1035271 RepID=UPI003CEFD346
MNEAFNKLPLFATERQLAVASLARMQAEIKFGMPPMSKLEMKRIAHWYYGKPFE